MTRFPFRLGAAGPLLVFVLLFALLAVFVPDFLSLRNMRGLVLSVTLVGTARPSSSGWMMSLPWARIVVEAT